MKSGCCIYWGGEGVDVNVWVGFEGLLFVFGRCSGGERRGYFEDGEDMTMWGFVKSL